MHKINRCTFPIIIFLHATILAQATERNCSYRSLIYTSSSSPQDKPEFYFSLVRGDILPFAFYTTPESSPWVILKLEKTETISRLKITNSLVNPTDSTGLSVALSQNGKTWKNIWSSNKFDLNWNIDLSKFPEHAQYIKIYLKTDKPRPLHLSRVEVFSQK